MEITEQAKLILNVLTAMKDCLDRDDKCTTIGGGSFSLSSQNGICWHVFAYTPTIEVSGISNTCLKPVFEEMGLDMDYPVEYQLAGNYLDAACMHWSQRNLYAMDTDPGKLRYQLLCDLIEYFNKVLANKM